MKVAFMLREKYPKETTFIRFSDWQVLVLLAINSRACKNPFIVVKERGEHVDVAKGMQLGHTSSF
jgi:hypothetical protein